MPLAVCRRPGAYQRAAVRVHLDRTVLAAAEAVGDLDVGRHADAEQRGLTRSATPPLFGAKLGVPGGGQRLVEGSCVLARVVGGTGRCGEGKRTGDQVPTAHLDGIHAQFGGETIHHALNRGGRLRPSGAPVGLDGHGVGHHRTCRHRHRRDVVGARPHQPGHERQHGPDRRVGPAVLDHVEAIGQHRAVATPADRGVLHLRPPMAQPEHRLGPGLHPPHGAVEAPGQLGGESLLGVQPVLGAEPAADVGADHPHLRLVEPEHDGQTVPHTVWVLGGRPVGETTVPPARCRHPHLERHRRQALVDDALGHDDLTAIERVTVAEIGAVGRGNRHGGVGAHLGVQHQLIGCGTLGIDHRRQRVDLDDHPLGGVDRLGTGLGHHRCNRLADEAHPVGGEQRPGHPRRRHAQRRCERRKVEVVGGDHGDHPWSIERLGRIDVDQLAVGDARAHKYDVGGASQLEVLHKSALAPQQRVVLNAVHPRAEDAATRRWNAAGLFHSGPLPGRPPLRRPGTPSALRRSRPPTPGGWPCRR